MYHKAAHEGCGPGTERVNAQRALVATAPSVRGQRPFSPDTFIRVTVLKANDTRSDQWGPDFFRTVKPFWCGVHGFWVHITVCELVAVNLGSCPILVIQGS